MKDNKIVVTSVAFSKNQYLRQMLHSHFKYVIFNDSLNRLKKRFKGNIKRCGWRNCGIR